ncbi:thioredoxin [Hokovirus HKV1]|uniref:Thioredoxin n=1 Tax=Hokovirus HKV1 TaxID=1977638 RepID=A0A1V0SFE0_9VIRU|nr:thioredoxin [Hokovirus HKV1]
MFKDIDTIEEFVKCIYTKKYACINFDTTLFEECKLFLPDYEKVSNMIEYSNFDFYKVNLDKIGMDNFDIRMYPTIMIFNKGSLINIYHPPHNKTIEQFKNYLNNKCAYLCMSDSSDSSDSSDNSDNSDSDCDSHDNSDIKYDFS